MNEMTRAIMSLNADLAHHGVRPEDVNDGNCEWFAEEASKQVPGSFIVWDDMIMLGTPGEDGGSHCFVIYDNRAYDSECPQGTTDWGMLPFFVRERMRRLITLTRKLSGQTTR